MLAYGIVYWALYLSLHSVTSTVLYIGYLLLLALFVFLITGTCTLLPMIVCADPPGTSHATVHHLPCRDLQACVHMFVLTGLLCPGRLSFDCDTGSNVDAY